MLTARARSFMYEPTGNFRHYWYQHPLFLPTSQLSSCVPPTAVPVHVNQSGPAFLILPCRPQVLTPEPPQPQTFTDYVATLAQWDQHLVSKLVLSCSPAQIQSTFTTPTVRLFLCSDGSAAMFTGTFGCVCSTDSGERLFHLHGPAPGYRTSSFRSESYGMLALLRAVIHITTSYGFSLPTQLIFYTDSKSLINTVEKRLEWSYDFRYSTMEADWDIQQGISTSLRQFPEIPRFLHVRGHQDRLRPYATLPLAAQLNVDADRLADSYEYPSSISSTHAPLITGGQALLHSPKGTINSNYRSNLRYLATWKTLRQYLCNRNEWSFETFESIDWTSHGRAIKAIFTRRQFYIKFLHDWLPLGYLRSRYTTYYAETCPLCNPPVIETRTHFLCCPHRHWKGPLLEELQQFWRKQHLDPTLNLLLTEMIHSWLANVPPSFPTVSLPYQSLITQQRCIGFAHIFFGRFTTQWRTLQDLYLSTTDYQSRSVSGTHFVTGTIKLMWNHIHALWLTRNHNLHGDSPQTIEAASYAQAQREVLALYDLRTRLPPSERDIFYSSPEHTLQRKPLLFPCVPGSTHGAPLFSGMPFHLDH